MNSYQLADILSGYPVSICPVDAVRPRRGRFVIANTDTSQGPGEHLVVFYFPKRGSDEFFDSTGSRPEDHGVGFEKILNKKHLMYTGQLQQSTFNVCGLLSILRHETTSWENHERHYQNI